MLQEKANIVLSWIFTGLATIMYRFSLSTADQWTEYLLHTLSAISVFMLIVINFEDFIKKIRKFKKWLKDKKQIK